MKSLKNLSATSLVLCTFLVSCSYTYDEEATRNIVGIYRFSYANTYTLYNNAQNAVVTDWSAENDYSVVIDKEGYLRIYKGDQILHEGLIGEIEDFGSYQTVYYVDKENSFTLHINHGRLTIVDFPFYCIGGNSSYYGNYFYKETADHCISCEQSDVLQGTYMGNMTLYNYNNVIIDAYPDTVVVSAENIDISCKLRLSGIFDGVYHVNSLLQLVENMPAEGAHFQGDTLTYGKYYNGTGSNVDYIFVGVKQP